MTQKKKSVGTAALWFAMDGYSTAKGVNGRRIAGESFLKGYLRHTRANELVTYGASKQSVANFASICANMGNKRPVHGGIFDEVDLPKGQTNLYLPTPNIAAEGWRRARGASDRYSISGVTHTISTERVLRAMCDMRIAPIMPWDAIICTSKAVFDSLTHQLDEYDRHLKFRFGKIPERFQMPIIPLGINTDDFVITKSEREKWRKKLNIEANDLAVVSTARLASFEKFDPIPMFMALQAASERCDHKIHLIGLGQYSDNVARKMFENGSKRYAPDIVFHHVDGAKDPGNRASIAAADVFALPVENIQETFGLSPVEAMAAGLPVVVTDWNGFKDTVTPECGFMIKTTGPTPGAMSREAWRYDGKLDSYNQFIGLASQMTVVDVKQMTDAFEALFNSPDLRRKMGRAGQKRAKSHLDWKQVIPKYEDLWAELDERRAVANSTVPVRPNSPEVPDPTRMFANYPSELFDRKATFKVASHLAQRSTSHIGKAVDELITFRGLKSLNRKTASTAHYVRGLQIFADAEVLSFDEFCKSLKGLPVIRCEKMLLWYLKYGLVEKVTK